MSNAQIKRKFEDNLVENKKMNRNSTLGQDFINYNSVPSLETIAIIKVTTGLCKLSDIRDVIRQHPFEYDCVGGKFYRSCLSNSSFRKIKKITLMKLSPIQLPNLLKEKVADCLTPVVLQMMQWIRYGRNDLDYIDSVCWTIEGTIDKVKTFEQLISKDSAQYHIKSLYELACTYCLEDSIFNLWNKLPETLQNDYGEMVYRKYDNHLIAYWISAVKNELSDLLSTINQYDPLNLYNCNNSIYKNMFTLAVTNGNLLAVKYFWNKLTNNEISSNLTRWIYYSIRNKKSFYTKHQNIYDYSEVLFFLLSQMDGSIEQKEVFQKYRKVILLSLSSDWPWRRFLLPTIQTIWYTLDNEVYLKLLSSIVSQIEEGEIIPKLLRKVWHDSPINLKKCFMQYIISNRYNTNVFCKLLAVGDVETIRLILNYANSEEKKQIIFSMVRIYDIYEVFYADKFSLFDTLLYETVSSDSEIQNLKEKIKLEHGNSLCCHWIVDDNFQMVEKFFNWAFTSQEEIDYFKNKTLDKIEVTYSIIKGSGNYELVDKFLGWCFSTDQEIIQFKRKFPESKYYIVRIGEENWDAFEKFIRWCFYSDEDINDIKCSLTQSSEISQIIRDSIVYAYNFEFPGKLIDWCCNSNEEIKQFKARFVLSETWLNILQRFVSNYKLYSSDYNNWELTRKLIKLFFPLEENVTVKLKELIRRYVDFDDFRGDFKSRPYLIREKDLFRLMDDNNYNRDEKNSSSDNDYSGTVNDHEDKP